MSIDENGRIEAELNIENFDSEDSSEKLSLVFNRKRDIPSQEPIIQEFVEQESLNSEDEDVDTNNEYTDEDGRMAVEFNVNLLPLRTSQLENDSDFQSGEQVQEAIEGAIQSIDDRIDKVVEDIEDINSRMITDVVGSGTIEATKIDNTVTVASKTFVFEQAIPSKIWEITHNLNKRPNIVLTYYNGVVFEGYREYVDNNNVRIILENAATGYANLN